MIYFTSDTHFEHENVVTKMGRDTFKSIKEHDAVLIENINKTVGVRDTLWILGDFAWKNPARWRMKIRCKYVKFVIGNHDKVLKSKQTFGEIPQIVVTKFTNGEQVCLCHYPILFWPKSHHNIYHLYGHMHRQREDWINNLIPDRRSMDVGVDNAYRLLGEYVPFREDVILDLLSSRKGHDDRLFYQETRVPTARGDI